MKLENKLIDYKFKTITKDKISEVINEYSDELLFEQIYDCCIKGLLEPIKSSKTNGNNVFTIYNKYKVKLPETDYSGELSEIKSLHPDLNKSEYLRNKPEEYIRYKKQIKLLSKWLFDEKSKELEKISKKERSFEIFKEEKELDNNTFWGFLNRVGINEDTLGFYNTPDYCFNDYIPAKKPNMSLLICENKDIWFNFRRLMYEKGYNSFFNIALDGVIFGNGNKVSNKNILIEYSYFLGINPGSITYYYWGDIDREGFEIFNRVLDNNKELNIKLFIPGYIKMLDLAESNEIPDSGDNRNHQLDFNKVYSLFNNVYADKIRKYIEENKRIPQEIISFTILKQMAKRV